MSAEGKIAEISNDGGEGAIRAIFEKLLDLLFPPRCPFCRTILKDHEKTICARCARELPWTAGEAQKQKLRHVEACVSPLFYEGDVRRSLLRYKFGGMSLYAPKYARLMEKCISENAMDFDLIAWVPVSRKRLKKRGYDQAMLLAQELSASLRIPCPQLLVKTADNPPQSVTGSAEKRRSNVSGVYRVVDPFLIKDQNVLIVDDIVTTGATLNECARVLKAAGAKKIYAAALARSRYE